MPYVIRQEDGKIIRATVRPVIGAEAVSYDNPDLAEFLRENGQEQTQVMDAIGELRKTDADMSRAVEDVIMALMKKNILKMSDLPRPVQDRMALRVRLRLMVQDIYDKASSSLNFGASSEATLAKGRQELGSAMGVSPHTPGTSPLDSYGRPLH